MQKSRFKKGTRPGSSSPRPGAPSPKPEDEETRPLRGEMPAAVGNGGRSRDSGFQTYCRNSRVCSSSPQKQEARLHICGSRRGLAPCLVTSFRSSVEAGIKMSSKYRPSTRESQLTHKY